MRPVAAHMSAVRWQDGVRKEGSATLGLMNEQLRSSALDNHVFSAAVGGMSKISTSHHVQSSILREWIFSLALGKKKLKKYWVKNLGKTSLN